MSADVHGKPMSGASAHLIASSWTSANTFRRSLALNVTRMPGYQFSHAELMARNREFSAASQHLLQILMIAVSCNFDTSPMSADFPAATRSAVLSNG